MLVTEETSLLSRGFAGIITKDLVTKRVPYHKLKFLAKFSDKLDEGDCILIGKDGTITVLWEKKAPMNPLLLTEMCDCRCLMCPQPPKAHDRTLTGDK